MKPEAEDGTCNLLYKRSETAAVIAALLFRRNIREEVLFVGQIAIIRTGPKELAITLWTGSYFFTATGSLDFFNQSSLPDRLQLGRSTWVRPDSRIWSLETGQQALFE